MSVTLDIVKRYAPVVYFHENERYFPCSIEYVLQNSVLKDRNQPSWQFQDPTQATLQQYHMPNYYVEINPSQFGGMGVTAPIYYAVQEYEDAVQISYLMLYAYQGGQTCRALRVGTEFNCIVKTLGIHQGDLERVVVTLIPREEGQYQVLHVGYEAHGDLKYYPTQRVAWENDHPVINIALNGHSCHNMFNEGERVTEYEQPGSVAIISALSQSGTVWRPSTNNQFKQLGLDSNGNPIGDQVWAAFQGRLGDSQDNELDSATYFDGSNLSAMDWDFVKLTDWAAKLFDKYPENIVHGNGAPGPGGRDWVTPASGKLFDDGLRVLQAFDDVSEGSGAVKWLAGNVASVGRHEVVQCWDNDSSLGMIMYGSDGSNALTRLWRSDNMGDGPGAVAWAVGDFNGDGKDEIVQCWDNDSRLGMIMYGSDGSNALTRLWRSDNMGEGPGAVTWLVGNYFGNDRDQIIQGWANGSSLGMIMYGTVYSQWFGQRSLGGAAKELSIGSNSDGRLELFYIGIDDNLYHNFQTTPSGGWYGESPFSGAAKKIVIGSNSDGRLELFYIGTDNNLYHNWQTTPNGGWFGERPFGGAAKELAISSNGDGRLELFYVGIDDNLYHNFQTTPNGGWFGESPFGGAAKKIVIGSNSDGRLELLYIGTDNNLYHNWQTTLNGGWFGQRSFGGAAKRIAIGSNSDGRLELFYIGTDNNLYYYNWQR